MENGIIFAILLIFAILKFYKNRVIFKELTSKEWIQYIVALIVTIIVAAGFILIGKQFTDGISISGLKLTLQIVIILIGLLIGGLVFNKTIPKKLNEFYK